MKLKNVHLYSNNVFRRLRAWRRGTGGETPSIEKNAVNQQDGIMHAQARGR